jgi:hypothetical protein
MGIKRSIAFLSRRRHDNAMSFRLREWFWIVLALGLAMGWFIDRRSQASVIGAFETLLSTIKHVQRPYPIEGMLHEREVQEIEKRLHDETSESEISSIQRLPNGDVQVWINVPRGGWSYTLKKVGQEWTVTEGSGWSD